MSVIGNMISPQFVLACALALVILPVRAADADACKAAQVDARIAACTRLIESGRLQVSDLADALNNRGRAKRDVGDLAGARADYDRSLAIAPRQSVTYVDRGRVKREMGDIDGAIGDLGLAIEIDPNNVSAFASRSYERRTKGDLDGALADAERAVAIDSKSSFSQFARGRAKTMKGNLQGALADLVRATELAPKNLVYRQGLGFLKREMGDLDGAIIDFSRATETDPSDAYSRYILAVAKREKGDVAGAITDFDRAFELDPSYWDALIGRGTARRLNAEPALAVADLAQARKAGHHPITSLRYRLMLLRNGRRDIGELQGHLSRVNDAAWPWPLVALYIFDQGTPASALGAAENKDPAVRKVQICQASFYIGQWQLLKDERANAVASLRNARDLCPKTVFEYTATVHELRRLGE